MGNSTTIAYTLRPANASVPGSLKLEAPPRTATNWPKSKKKGSSRTPANTVIPRFDLMIGTVPVLTRTFPFLALFFPERLSIRASVPVTSGAAGPRKFIFCRDASFPVTNA